MTDEARFRGAKLVSLDAPGCVEHLREKAKAWLTRLSPWVSLILEDWCAAVVVAPHPLRQLATFHHAMAMVSPSDLYSRSPNKEHMTMHMSAHFFCSSSQKHAPHG